MQFIDEKNSVKRFSVGIVVSRFNEPVTKKLLQGALERLQELDFSQDQIQVVWVPGAVEIPLAAKRLITQTNIEAVIALGAVIRGETSHYDYVCDQVSQGCQCLSFEYDLPVVFGVLTTENADQAFDRVGGAKGHKGREAVDVAVEMMCVLEKIEHLSPVDKASCHEEHAH